MRHKCAQTADIWIAAIATALVFACGGCGSPTEAGSIAFLRGDGHGGFELHDEYQAGYPVAFSIGDLDNDASPDIAVANETGVGVLLGGTTGFSPIRQVHRSPTPGSTSVAIADFDHDGNADILVGDADGTVFILFGYGDSSFDPVLVYSGPGTMSLTQADFNQDGLPDLAVANFRSTSVAVLINMGARSFSTPILLEAATSPYSILALDVDKNGTTDLVTSNVDSQHSVATLLGTTGGMFLQSRTVSIGRPMYTLAAADINNDNNVDLVVSGNASLCLFGDGKGNFSIGNNIPTAQETAFAVDLADFDKDGNVDLAVTHLRQLSSDCKACSVGVLLGNGDGTFQTEVLYVSGEQPTFIQAVDIDQDGIVDLLVANSAGGASNQ